MSHASRVPAREFVRSLVAVLLLSVAVSAVASDTAPPEAEKKPGFWKRLATEGLRVELGKDGVRTGPAQNSRATTRQGTGSNAEVYKGDSDEPMYTSLTGASSLDGLFASDDGDRRRRGLLDWPRAAVTFTEFGSTLECWEGKARIWQSASKHTEETFRLCNSPGVIRDAFGQEGRVNWQVVATYGTQLGNAQLMTPNSGAQRTQGPQPPRQPFGFQRIRKMEPGGLHAAADPMGIRLDAMLVRLAWVTGYLSFDEMEGIAGAGMTAFRDPRLWVVGFDATGNRDVQP